MLDEKFVRLANPLFQEDYEVVFANGGRIQDIPSNDCQSTCESHLIITNMSKAMT